MNRKKEMILALVGIFILIFFMFGVTYAVFTYTKLGSTENIITTGALRFLYTENSGGGTGISITNAKPIADSEGMGYTSDGTVFDFKLEGTNTSDDLFYYKITLEKDKTSTLDESAIKVYLTDVDSDDKQLKGPILYSDLAEYNYTDDVRETFLYQGSVSNDYSKNFRLRMWISDSIDFESGDYDSKNFAAMINVYFDNSEFVETLPLNSALLSSNQVITTTPTLTNSSNNTSNASGLYKSTATNFNGVEGTPTYYFRGNVENNYLSFAGFTWRIVRINEDGTFRIIMNDNSAGSDVFNPTDTTYTGMYFSNSNAKTQLDIWFTNNITNKGFSSKVATGNYFCEQAKVKYSSSYTSGSASMTYYGSYKPNFKCSPDKNGHGLVNTNIGLITYDEVVHAGGYYDKTNSDYYLCMNSNYITMSPAGVASDGIAEVWRVRGTGNILLDDVTVKRVLKPVINLKANTIVSGTGLIDDMYIVQ